jgi:hypothetical protein
MGSTLSVPVSADTYGYESQNDLVTCTLFWCNPTEVYGLGASILVNNEATPGAGQIIAEWVSLDDFNACCTSHFWMQAGYAIGALPDGTFASQPVFYTESYLPTFDNTGTVYKFHNKGAAAFGTWHSFKIWTGGNAPSTTFVSIDGVQQEAVSEQYFLKGQATGALEAHEGQPPQPDGNGHWTSLQFYGLDCYVGCGASWKAWGSNDGNSLLGGATSAQGFITCPGYALQQISTTEFTVGGAAQCSGGMGGSSRRTFVPPLAVSPQLIGQGPNGGAREGQSTINPITYWVVGIIVAAPAIYGAYIIRKRRMAKRESDRVRGLSAFSCVSSQYVFLLVPS